MGAPPEIAIGAKVAKGQVLAETSAEGAPAALAPTSGRIIGVGEAALTNGHAVPVAELE
jgi:Na+-translocating ferredoxin:NAD+ oxidoreductase RnfC subunit